ncbi:MAG TPA: exonuclease domain-containing protein [Candidatus Saccharimonadales bacterium]|nr:exonuclease domain-containing protein [Candidatus Saccharimonadales bacterium]
MSVLGEPLVFVDIETNGLDHIRGRVVEVGAIRVEDGAVVGEFRQLIDPGTPLPQFITNLTGIRQGDLKDAPLFMAIADELHDFLDGAVFVAHNVRFDYSFLKQEFKRVGKSFNPKQLCTVRLSRALFPQYRTHKLQDLIARHNLEVAARHRAYDDAHALWQFMQLVQSTTEPTVLQAAIAKQIKKPSLPKGLDPHVVAALPGSVGVYILEDEKGVPIYIGKSINIKKRVASHFMRDHDNVSEFKIAQHVRSISHIRTGSELEALLLESQLVKEKLPLYNKQLRRVTKVMLARRETNDDGYDTVRLEEADSSDIPTADNVLAVYTRRGKAKATLEQMVKDWSLCPKLLGLEKSKGACFMSQLGRCKGACAGNELATAYNARLSSAFERSHIEPWPFKGPVVLQEKTAVQEDDNTQHGLVVDKWRIIGRIRQEPYCEPVFEHTACTFDLDAYNILKSYLTTKLKQLSIRPLPAQYMQQLQLLA